MAMVFLMAHLGISLLICGFLIQMKIVRIGSTVPPNEQPASPAAVTPAEPSAPVPASTPVKTPVKVETREDQLWKTVTANPGDFNAWTQMPSGLIAETEKLVGLTILEYRECAILQLLFQA
jgi:hypothetical protein